MMEIQSMETGKISVTSINAFSIFRCSSTCEIETGYACIDGNLPSKCSEICGDGIRFNHACDDGNTQDNDGCSSKCVVEAGY